MVRVLQIGCTRANGLMLRFPLVNALLHRPSYR